MTSIAASVERQAQRAWRGVQEIGDKTLPMDPLTSHYWQSGSKPLMRWLFSKSVRGTAAPRKHTTRAPKKPKAALGLPLYPPPSEGVWQALGPLAEGFWIAAAESCRSNSRWVTPASTPNAHPLRPPSARWRRDVDGA